MLGFLRFGRMTPNGQGLAMGWYFMTVCPEPKLIKKLKVQDNNKKLNSKSSAGTVAETELQLIDFSSASLTPNPLLYCRFFFAFLEQKIRQGTVAQTQQKACLKNGRSKYILSQKKTCIQRSGLGLLWRHLKFIGRCRCLIKLQKLKIYSNARAYPSAETEDAG